MFKFMKADGYVVNSGRIVLYFEYQYFCIVVFNEFNRGKLRFFSDVSH